MMSASRGGGVSAGSSRRASRVRASCKRIWPWGGSRARAFVEGGSLVGWWELIFGEPANQALGLLPFTGLHPGPVEKPTRI